MQRCFSVRMPRSWWAVTALVLTLTAGMATAVLAAVTLQRFGPVVLTSSIRMEWETASELDNAGFYLRRGLSTGGPYDRISGLIPSSGDSLAGATYAFTDTNVVVGTTYYYELEAIALNQVSTFYGPVAAALLDVAGTQTATAVAGGPTRTATATATRTVTPPAAAATTATPTLLPTIISAYPGPAASATVDPANPQPTLDTSGTPEVFANQAEGALTDAGPATATLIPLPDITLQFATPTPVAVALASGERASGEAVAEESSAGWFTPGRAAFLGVLALIWVLLGVWFYFSLQRMQ